MVLFVTYSGVLGGAERLLVDFASGLHEECAIACPPGPLACAARAAGLRTLPLAARDLRLRGGRLTPARAAAAMAGHAAEVRRLARALDPDVLVAWSMRTALAAAVAAPPSLPVAFQHNDFLPAGMVGALVRGASRRMSLITAPSHAVLADLTATGGSAAGTAVVAPGVDVAHFAATGAPDGAEILVLGAITAWKRPDLALDVLAEVRRHVPAARLRFAGAPLPGDGDELLADLQRRAAGLGLAGAVQFAGQVDDPVGELARCACLLHCAPREPFGIAVLEALAAGRPAVVPDSAGPAEIVDAASGRRYRPGDAHGAAAALRAILTSPDGGRAMGASGRARAAGAFTLAGQQARYRAALAPLARPRRPLALAGELTLLTVTHNSAAELPALLASAARHLPGAHVVVADCASSDDTVSVARAHPGADVLELANLGFGRACNRALERVRTPVTALVNPDVELIDDSLLELVIEARASGGERRLLAPRVLNPDATPQDTVHPAPLSAPDLARAIVPPAALPGRLGVALAPWRAQAPRTVGWAVGCALVARTTTLAALGPFEERIFLYGEDMELGLRAAREGVATWYWPAARLIHHGGHSIEAAYRGEAFALRAKARHDAVALALGERRARIDDAAQALTFAGRIALKRAVRRPAHRERHQLAAVLRVAGVRGG